MSDSTPPLHTVVIANNGSYAAGRDQTIHLHAIPCADCERRFVRHAAGVCRHCAMRGVVIGSVLLWLVLASLAVIAGTRAEWGSDALFGLTVAAACAAFAVGWCVLKRRSSALSS